MIKHKITILTFLHMIIFCDMLHAQAHLVAGESIFEAGNRTINSISNPKDNETFRPIDNHARSMMSGILWDQSEHINYPGQGFNGADASGTTGALLGVSVKLADNHILADDFIIPSGERWELDSIVLFNYQTNSGIVSTINDVKMLIRQGNTAGTGTIVFGDMSTNRLASTYFSGKYRTLNTALTNQQRPIMKSKVNTNGISLNSGNYMMEHLVGGTLTAGPFSIQRTFNTTHETTGNARQFNMAWIDVLENDAFGDNPLAKGLTFIVYGTSFVDKAAEVNGMQYNTLQEAVDAVSFDGENITLLKNINDAVINIGLNNRSVAINANGFNCSIDYLNISNGTYLNWKEDTLFVTTSINNNSSGILWNNAIINIPVFNNTGIYKSNGTIIGQMNNLNTITPGN